MSSSKLSVVVTRRLPKPVEDRLAELFDAELNVNDVPFTQDQLINAIGRADILVPTLNDTLDAHVLAEAGDQLKLIANYGSGYDHIDIEAADARGIMVTNAPGLLSEDSADMTLALILTVMRRFKEGSAALQSGNWKGWSPSTFLGSSIGGKTLAIIGMGRVGMAVARRANAFGMKVVYHNRSAVHPEIERNLDATYIENLEEMLPMADVLSLHCPNTPETHHLMNADRLALMKPTAFIINTARGQVIDEDALIAALEVEKLAGAGLDVFEKGSEVNPKLCDRDNVMLLPHMASATTEARVDMGERVILNIKTFELGHRPPDQVIPQR
ncbi:D-glycerate dehydrogenase [Amylibacter sp. SFDW26]|uniref:2-hydroxyacid dehydrogenase n=1 Tax=Amylibacter sp. SFDW26 TaxID=2652722 RepID=UPI00126168C9|nr:D-glycerate dehydrogenase [Amylibacter sp. SFDW26]KAB7613528.1 D-glycerate dehydrogenase [Amylibacter sp. SFDW26]